MEKLEVQIGYVGVATIQGLRLYPETDSTLKTSDPFIFKWENVEKFPTQKTH